MLHKLNKELSFCQGNLKSNSAVGERADTNPGEGGERANHEAAALGMASALRGLSVIPGRGGGSVRS